MSTKKYDIYDRAFNFAVRVVKFVEKLPENLIAAEYSGQLIRASGSIGANIEEADGALSKKDFIHKIGIARRESRESKHWLRLIESTIRINNQSDREELSWLIGESTEILLILSSIIRNAQSKSKD